MANERLKRVQMLLNKYKATLLHEKNIIFHEINFEGIVRQCQQIKSINVKVCIFSEGNLGLIINDMIRLKGIIPFSYRNNKQYEIFNDNGRIVDKFYFDYNFSGDLMITRLDISTGVHVTAPEVLATAFEITLHKNIQRQKRLRRSDNDISN